MKIVAARPSKRAALRAEEGALPVTGNLFAMRLLQYIRDGPQHFAQHERQVPRH